MIGQGTMEVVNKRTQGIQQRAMYVRPFINMTCFPIFSWLLSLSCHFAFCMHVFFFIADAALTPCSCSSIRIHQRSCLVADWHLVLYMKRKLEPTLPSRWASFIGRGPHLRHWGRQRLTRSSRSQDEETCLKLYRKQGEHHLWSTRYISSTRNETYST